MNRVSVVGKSTDKEREKRPSAMEKRQSAMEKRQSAAVEKRTSYLQNTLREIREKRLSYDAPAKGTFPARTPSRLLSNNPSPKSKSQSGLQDLPLISLTKLDFELLRDWDWKERKKRLESWRDELGLEPKHQKHPGRRGSEDDHKSRRGKKPEQGVSRKVLKRELEHLTGLRVYAPGSVGKKARAPAPLPQVSAGARRSLASQKQRARSRVSSTEKGSITSDFTAAPSLAPPPEPSEREIRQQRLDNLMAEANKALESKRNFGKKWGGTGSISAAPTPVASSLSRPSNAAPSRVSSAAPSRLSKPAALQQRQSSVAASVDVPDNMTSRTGMTGRRTLRSRSTKHHHHHHRSHRSPGARSIASSRRTLVEESPQSSIAPSITGSIQSSRVPTSRYHRTDVEEEQPHTSFSSSLKSSRKSTRPPSQHRNSDSPASPSSSAASVGVNELLRGMQEILDDSTKSEEDDEQEDKQQEDQQKKYQRPPQPVEYQDTCFGGIMFVDRGAVKPMSKLNKEGFEYYMNIDNDQLGLGKGTQELKVKFFKADGSKGRSSKVLVKKLEEKKKKALDKEEKRLREEAEEAAAKEEKPEATTEEDPTKAHLIRNFAEIVGTGLLEPPNASGKSRREQLAEYERALLQLPGISSRWQMEVSAASRHSVGGGELPAVNRIPKRNAFTRPPRRIWYTPLPLTIKRYYRTNWKKIRFDIRKLMKQKHFWPKLWINFEESHPQKLYELIRAKLAVKDFDKHGFKRVFDWGRGVHPDYIDWIVEDIVPHPGRYYYQDKHEGDHRDGEAVRRASVEESDFKLQDWFVKPPRYIPDTPLSPPFDMHDFCGYGNRQKPFFLAFTLPREIIHYYAPPSSIQKFFRNIPKPPYAFPGYTFKRWIKYPLDQKLPQYYPFPKRFMIWTKGKIGEPVQCNASEFYTDDPLIKKRDIVYSPYHDSHTRKYILRKDVLDRIWELGLINSKGEVRCTMAEFNKNRLFLRDYEWMEEAMKRWDTAWNDRQQQIHLTKDANFDDQDWEAKKQEWRAKLNKVTKNMKERDAEKQSKFKAIVERTERMLEEMQIRRELRRQELLERARKKHEAQVRRRNLLRNMEAYRIVQLKALTRQKDINAEQYRRRYFLENMATKQVRERERWRRHVEFHEQKVAYLRRLEIELERDFNHRTKLHKQKVKRQRADINGAILRKKQHENYANSLALKYGRIWLKKVRERRKLLPDESHLSTWNYSHHMEGTVTYLKEMSGHIDLNTFFFETFKKALKEQLEKEEQEEEALRQQQEPRPKTRRPPPKPSTGYSTDGDKEDDEEEKDDENYLASGEESDEPEVERVEKLEGYEADEDEDG